MDRDNRWERIKLAYDLLIKGQGKPTKDIVKIFKTLMIKVLQMNL